MDYRASLNNRGFSMIEMMVVVSIIGILSTISIAVYSTWRTQNNVDIACASIVEALRLAKTNSEQVNRDSSWGTYIASDQVVVFAGATYASRDTSLDKPLTYPGGVTISGLSEVVFSKIAGTTTNTGIITISNSAKSKTISINAKGTITY